jgi:hypothetical protein
MTDIVDRIRQVALALGWRFTYGEQDIKNLIEAAQAQDLVPDEVHLMLLPVVRTPVTNEYGGISQINYELAFSIFTPDDFDILVEDAGKEYYWQKFDYKVKPMLTAYYYLHRNLICPGVVMQARRITEIYNDGTENLTGIFIEATASIDVDSRLGEVVPVPPLPPMPTLCDLLADCEVFKSLDERVTALEAITPEDLISSNSGNQLTTGTDGGLYVATGGGGGGLTCEDLEDCQVIQDIEEALDGKANTSDLAEVALSGAYADLSGTPTLATVATTGSYNDLTDKPTIPTVPTVVSAFTNDANYQSGAQVAASLLPFLPLVSYYGDAGHTGDTNETVVLTFEIQPGQWLNRAMYQVICDCTRAAGTVTYQVYLNTSPVVAGGLRILGYPGTAANINLFRHFSVDGNNIRHNANTAALTTDIGATANVSMTDGTLDRSVAVFIVVTVTGNANTANGAFKNIQIGLV